MSIPFLVVAVLAFAALLHLAEKRGIVVAAAVLLVLAALL